MIITFEDEKDFTTIEVRELTVSVILDGELAKVSLNPSGITLQRGDLEGWETWNELFDAYLDAGGTPPKPTAQVEDLMQTWLTKRALEHHRIVTEAMEAVRTGYTKDWAESWRQDLLRRLREWDTAHPPPTMFGPLDEDYASAAEKIGAAADLQINVDQDAVVSRGSDQGAFVACWLWVAERDAETEQVQRLRQRRA